LRDLIKYIARVLILVFLPVLSYSVYAETVPKDLPLATTSQCDYGILTWRDAYIVTKVTSLDTSKLDSTFPLVTSIGCIAQTPEGIMIVHSFTGGQPDTFMLIPKAWILGIQRFNKNEVPLDKK